MGKGEWKVGNGDLGMGRGIEASDIGKTHHNQCGSLRTDRLQPQKRRKKSMHIHAHILLGGCKTSIDVTYANHLGAVKFKVLVDDSRIVNVSVEHIFPGVEA